MQSVTLYDTTLRDGTQGEQVTLSAEDKLSIARKLDDFGIHYIEGGWPGSNPKDARFFHMARKTPFGPPGSRPSGARESRAARPIPIPTSPPCSRPGPRW